MGSITDFLEDELIDHVLKVGVYTAPSVIAIALGTIASDGAFTEIPNAQSYARVSVTAGNWSTAAGRLIQNTAAITFPTAAGSWGTPDVWACFTSVTYGGGDYLAYGDITTPTAIGINDTPSFASNEIQISFNAAVSNVGWSDYLVHELLDHVWLKGAYTPETNLYVGFGATPLTDAGTIDDEAHEGGYAREIENTWSVSSGGASSNPGAITFTVSGTWKASPTDSMDVMFLANSLSGTANSDLMMFGTVTGFSPVDGDTVEVAIGDFDVTLT